MAKLLQDWRNDPNTVMGTLRETAEATLMSKSGHKTPGGITMLAPVKDKELSHMLSEQLRDGARGDDALCGKRQLIIDKFDALLKKLGGEELSLKIELGQVTKEWKDSMEAFLNAESQYRLRTEQAKEAEDGAKFAEEEYEKWRTAHKAARADFKKNEENKEAELKDLAAEEKMIRKIMRYIGVLHDIKATEKSIAAGGRDSKKDPETGVSNPYDTSQKAVKTAQLAQVTVFGLGSGVGGRGSWVGGLGSGSERHPPRFRSPLLSSSRARARSRRPRRSSRIRSTSCLPSCRRATSRAPSTRSPQPQTLHPNPRSNPGPYSMTHLMV